MPMSLETHAILIRVGAIIRQKRLMMGIAIEQVMKDVGCSKRAAYDVERGLCDIKVGRLVVHAEAVGLTLDQIFKEVASA